MNKKGFKNKLITIKLNLIQLSNQKKLSRIFIYLNLPSIFGRVAQLDRASAF